MIHSPNFQSAESMHRIVMLALCCLFGCSETSTPSSSSLSPKGASSAVEKSVKQESNSASDPAIIARVGDAVIREELVLYHFEKLGGQVPLHEVLERLIELEVLSQEAGRAGQGASEEVQEVFRKGMVREFLHSEMVENHGVEAIRDDDYEFWYRRAYARFVHEDGYFATDAQFVCCQESELEKCVDDPEVETCFDAHAPIMEWVHSQLLERGPYPTKEAFQETVTQLSGEVQATRPLAQINVTFWHQPGVPYDQQTGYTKLNQNLVEAIVDTPVSSFTGPVRSKHGWHISYLFDFMPKKNLPVTDPGVRKEIAEHVYPLVQKRDFAFLIKKLETETQPVINASYLLKLEGEMTDGTTE